jgi:putrescine transport system permease protein
MGIGLLFLYTPIFILILYSFNASKLVTVWSGFSTHWYSTLWADEELMNATLHSIEIASYSATIAVVLGTMAGIALSRFSSFFGRTLFTGMLSAPFIIPEVITGFSLLLMFVAVEQLIGWPQKGILTVILAHSTIGIAYVAIIVQSRLSSFDRSLEEAAQDLGATPLKAFMVITLPIIANSLVAGWLLSFTLSLDDLVIASFTAGPGSTTLPMLIYSRVRSGISPQINALASIMIGFVITTIFVAYLISIKKSNK